MMTFEAVQTTERIQRCLVRLAADDPDARGELLEYARRRLEVLADRMFAKYPRLHFREESEDVFQEAMMRLWQSLEEVGPTSVAGFMGLAALQMRRALSDLVRRHFGRQSGSNQPEMRRPGMNGAGMQVLEGVVADSTWGPEEIACWSEFHAAASRLPEPDRTAFDLLYYHELPQEEVAVAMQVSVRQVRRYWQSARLELHRSLEGLLPGM